MRRIVKKRDFDSEINLNVTPFIDVIFAILIVFMVPSQTLFGNIKLELPPANAKIAVLDKDPIKVLVDISGNLIVNDNPIPIYNLLEVVNNLSLRDKSTKIYVMADRRIIYENVINIVDALNSDGFNDVVLISDFYNRL